MINLSTFLETWQKIESGERWGEAGAIYEALHIGLISSDESDVESDALATRPLTWRTDDVTKYFQDLDER